MRALIISIIILTCMLTFSIFNTIYINMKISKLTDLTRTMDSSNLSTSYDQISSIWNPLSRYLHLTVIDSKINEVEKAIERIRQIKNGADSNLMIARSNLLYALNEISELETITFLQIF